MRYAVPSLLLPSHTREVPAFSPLIGALSGILSEQGSMTAAVSALLGVLLFLTCTAAAKPPLRAGSRAEKLAREVTIYRDTYGVPHIYGPTDASCVFGYAFAQAEDNFKQIED